MSDIVIGARRKGSKKTLRSAGVLFVVLVSAAAAAAFGFRRLVSYPTPAGSVSAERPTAELQAAGSAALSYGPSSLDYAGELAVLRLYGEASELGEARGKLLGAALFAGAAPLAATLTDAVDAGGRLARALRGPRERWRYRKLADGIPGHQLVEIYGAALGAATSAGESPDYTELLRAQASLDVGAPATSADGEYRWIGRAFSAATTLDGAGGARLVIAHNFDLPGSADGGEAAARHRTVAFVHPDGGIPYASVEWPGLLGVVSGINAEGIAVLVHPAKTADVDAEREGQPIGLLARDVLEHARSVDDAIGVLREAEPLGAAAFLIADGAERSVIVVERSPEAVAIRRSPSPPTVTGILEASGFADDPENDRAARTWPEAQRAQRADELLAHGPLNTPADAAALLRDRLGEGGAPLPPGHRGAIDDPGAAHAAIFDATGMVLYVAEGHGASGAFRAFDLRYELRAEGSRPAPPAPIAADESGGDAASVLAARASLRAARIAQAEDRRDDAWHHIHRALARAPRLPEALVLGGELASARGDAQAAEALYRRYLEAGSDAPRTEQRVRAELDAR